MEASDIFVTLYSRGWRLDFMVKSVSLIWAFRYLVLIVGVRGWEGIMSVKVLTKIAQNVYVYVYVWAPMPH